MTKKKILRKANLNRLKQESWHIKVAFCENWFNKRTKGKDDKWTEEEISIKQK